MALIDVIKEESPYKPEAFDSRSNSGNAHKLAHKDLQRVEIS
jgi:hypothetical protein